MGDEKATSTYIGFFASLAPLFEARFLRPLWSRHPSCDEEPWEAVALFLDGYGFERQGARPDYRHVAVDTIDEFRRRSRPLTEEGTAQLVWDKFGRRLDGEDLNHANNPLCPCGTQYEREYKKKRLQSSTYGKSLIEFLSNYAKTGLSSNMVTVAKRSLEHDHLKALHEGTQNVNGIGPKISSLFLRDVAVFYDLKPMNDRHLLQPVDVWVRRTFELLANSNHAETDLEKMQKWILQESTTCNARPEAVNQGIWYYSSQVANSEYRMTKALSDLGYAKTLLSQHMKAVLQEGRVWERIERDLA